jgi:hypothetical protein
VKLRQSQPDVVRGFRAPALTWMCVLGFVASAAAIVIGFVPPSQFGDNNAGAYALLILAGTGLLGLLPPVIFLWRRKPSWTVKDGEGTTGGPRPVETAAVSTASEQQPEPAAAPAVVASSPPSGGRGEHRGWLIGAGVIVAVLCVVGLITYSVGSNNAEAQQKAQQLQDKYSQAGLPVPNSQEAITGALGTDGGAVCDNPASALGKATLYDTVTNGADFVGRRPVLIDRQVLQGELLILQVYCPDKLQHYKDTLNDLKFRNTVKGP